MKSSFKSQSKEWIKNLPVPSICSKNCILFLWAVSPQIPEALDVMKAWKFTYKTVGFCWSKETKYGKKVSNLGRYTMANIELCLIGTKGHPHRIIKNIRQLVVAQRTIQGHKPFEVRNRITQLMGDIPRIELFARPNLHPRGLDYSEIVKEEDSYLGWDVWGDET